MNVSGAAASLRDWLAGTTGLTTSQASVVVAVAVFVVLAGVMGYGRSLWSRRRYYSGLARGYRRASDSANGPSARGVGRRRAR